MTVPKYSIIIPVYNGMPYLEACLNTILTQDYDEYELIVSNDHSTDGSTEYLRSLSHPKLTLLEPDNKMSMTEHWEWALSHSRGEWQIFVGQDDGIQGYFFQLADRLTKIAVSKKIRAIVTRRAYLFWPGCEVSSGNRRIFYSAIDKIYSCNSCFAAATALVGGKAYHHLPQMYTSSLFHHSLLDEARSLQNGKVFSCHPQDANLAAVAISLEKTYLHCEIPISWVGTSPKSAGLAISTQHKEFDKSIDKKFKNLRKEYKEKVNQSDLKYNPLAGDFSFAEVSVYFWQALLETNDLHSSIINKILYSKAFRIILFSSVWARALTKGVTITKKVMFIDIIERNNLRFKTILLCAFIFRIVFFISKVLTFGFYRVPRKIYHMTFLHEIRYSMHADDKKELDLMRINKEIFDKVKKIIR